MNKPDSVLVYDSESSAFLGEYETEEVIPFGFYEKELGVFHLDRHGIDLVCREHIFMSPLPDLIIRGGYELKREEAFQIAADWWMENYSV